MVIVCGTEGELTVCGIEGEVTIEQTPSSSMTSQ